MFSFITGSLRAKLYSLVIVLIATALLVGLVGMYKLDQMNDRLNDMADISAEKIKLSGQLTQGLITITRAEKNIILAKTTQEMDEIAASVDQVILEMNEERDRLSQLLGSADQERLDQFSASWAKFLEVHRSVRDLAHLNSNVRAYQLSSGDALKAYNQLEAAIHQIDQAAYTQLQQYTASPDATVQRTLALSEQSRAAQELLRLVVEYQREEKRIIIAETKAGMDKYEAAAQNIEQAYHDCFQRLTGLVSADMSPALARVEQAFAAYDKLNNQVRALSEENGNQRAFDLARTEGYKLAEQAEAEIDAIAASAIDNMNKDKLASEESFTAAIWLLSSLILLSAAVCGALAWFIVAGITSGLSTVAQRASEIAEKDLTGEPLPVKTKDEVGKLTETMNTMSQSLQRIVSEVTMSAQEVAGAATEIASNAEELSTGIDEQTTQMAQVASAVEEMSQSITEVAGKSTDAAGNAKNSGEVATEGNEVVRQTIYGMESISEAVSASAIAVESLGKRGQQIGEVIDVINDIADQTNLLALNAAIEAARAGEHGRGFAVVADEVRKLADRTTKATEEIAESIQAIQTETTEAVERMNTGTEQVQTGVELATRAGDSLSEIVGSAQQVSAMIASIASAAEQQAAASEEISRSIQSVDAITRQSAEASNQSAAAATQLSTKAEQMQQLVAEFKVKA